MSQQTITFCEICDNACIFTVESMVPCYICRHCGYKKTAIESCIILYSERLNQVEAEKTNHGINKFTKFDPTLPRRSDILCPNKECSTNTHGDKREIVLFRSNDTDMNYTFICSTCDHVWKQ